MLFDVHFGLGSFCAGFCTVFAYEARAKGDDQITQVALSLIFFSVWFGCLQWHLRRHGAEQGWPLVRRMLPVMWYAIGVLLPLYLLPR